MASTGSPDASSAVAAEGPVMAVINKRLRALRKKLNRIAQMEESVAQGKVLNKEQEDVLRSKPGVHAIIEELERLRQPVSAALQEELSAVRVSTPPPQQAPLSPEEGADASTLPSAEEKAPEHGLLLEDLLKLLYYGNLFDVKPLSDYETTMLMRTHERGCCITYDPVTDETTSLLEEKDLDSISVLGSLLLSRPPNANVSHKNALFDCFQHAKLWLDNADQPIHPGSSYTYAGIRERLNRILSSDYATATPEFKPSVDLAAEVGKFTVGQVLVTDPTVHTENSHEESMQHFVEGDDSETSQREASIDQVNDSNEATELDGSDAPNQYGDQAPFQQELEKLQLDEEEHYQREVDPREQQYSSRRPYPNQRGVNRGGPGGGGGYRRGYVNGRGGRGGRGASGGYQNGRGQQYYDSGYYPRNNYYNGRGRGGRNGGYSHGTVYSGHAPGVELGAS